MTLTKNKMVREVGKRTRLKNCDVQVMLEALVEVWTEGLINGERIELENFFVLEVKTIDRGNNTGKLWVNGKPCSAPQYVRKLVLKPSKFLRGTIKATQHK